MLASPSYPPAQTCHSKLPPRTTRDNSLPLFQWFIYILCRARISSADDRVPSRPTKIRLFVTRPPPPLFRDARGSSLRLSSRSSGLISTATALLRAGRMMQNVPDKILHEPRACSQNLIEERIRVTNAQPPPDGRICLMHCGRHCSKGSKKSFRT